MLSLDIVLSPGGKTLLQCIQMLNDSPGITVKVIVWADASGQAATGASDVKRILKQTCLFQTRKDIVMGCANVEGGSMWWSTHQKHVTIFDPWSEDGYGMPGKLTSYVGGLDLAVGRYDDERKIVFQTEDTQQEFPSHVFNTMFDSPLKVAEWYAGRPRMPWHDVHSCIEGEASYELLKVWDFFWRAEGGDRALSCLTLLEGEDVVADHQAAAEPPSTTSPQPSSSSFVANPTIRGNPHNKRIFESMRQRWSDWMSAPTASTAPYRCQVYHCAVPQEGTPSIHHAWIQGIMSAREHIYIEQQFFQGWHSDRMEKRIMNLVPWAIAQKIKKVVEERGPQAKFHVYVVMPCVPDPDNCSLSGVSPGSIAKRMMLRFHYNTRNFIKKAVGSLWRRYITFLYPSRAIHDVEYPIYVHNKMMIVDDEVIYLGSANINDRSMRGDGDAEVTCVIEDVGMVLENSGSSPLPSAPSNNNSLPVVRSSDGAFCCSDDTTKERSPTYQGHQQQQQPQQSQQQQRLLSSSSGRIRQLRLDLMSEHAGCPPGQHMPEFNDPASRACVEKIQRATAPGQPGLGRWRQFPDDGLLTTHYFNQLRLDGGSVKKYMALYELRPDVMGARYLSA